MDVVAAVREHRAYTPNALQRESLRQGEIHTTTGTGSQ